MILAWRDNETHRVEARVRSAAGALGPPSILTHDLDENTGPTALAAGNGVIVWSDGVRRGQVVHLAHATGDGRFPAVRTIARVRWGGRAGLGDGALEDATSRGTP